MVAVLQWFDGLYENGRMIACKGYRLKDKNAFPASRRPG